MKKQLLFIAAIIFVAAQGKAQNNNMNLLAENVVTATSTTINETTAIESYSLLQNNGYNSFTRGQGFVIRPELYRGLYASLGYQINPYVQTFVSFGYGEGLEGALGVRAYTGDANWVAMFDLRASVTNFEIPGVSLVAGASFKDLDFGAGIKYYSDGYYYLIVPILSIGWNIRCYEHR